MSGEYVAVSNLDIAIILISTSIFIFSLAFVAYWAIEWFRNRDDK